MRLFLATSVALALLAGCNTGSDKSVKPEPKPTSTEAKNAPSPPQPTVDKAGPQKLGAPIAAESKAVALGDVAKSPDKFKDQTFVTTGTVTAVCEHMGCWMEIKDEQSQAHIKMAGHAFAIPRSASGRKARVEAKLVGVQGVAGHHADCNKEAEDQMGHATAKLELEAKGVELL